MYLKYSKVRKVKTPIRANAGDAIDLFIPEDFRNDFGNEVCLDPGKNIVIPSGLKFEVPFGFALVVMNKSGLAAKRELVVGACLIDHGYSGEVHIDLHNIGLNAQMLTAGQKITQLVMVPVAVPSLLEVDETDLYSDIAVVSDRGTGRMGSTGEQ